MTPQPVSWKDIHPDVKSKIGQILETAGFPPEPTIGRDHDDDVDACYAMCEQYLEQAFAYCASNTDNDADMEACCFAAGQSIQGCFEGCAEMDTSGSASDQEEE